MKTILILLALLSLSFASCYYNPDLGRIRCLEQIAPRASVMADTHNNSSIGKGVMAHASINDVPNNTESLNGTGIPRMLQSFRNLARQNTTNISSPIDADLSNYTPKNNSTYITYVYDARCEMARAKDWQTYLSIMRGEGIDISDEGVNQVAKNMILDNLLKSKSSNQAKCMRSLNS